MRLRTLFALAGGGVALVAATAGAAPAHDYVIETWSPDRGLPTSFVTSLAQTPDGYIWVGTQNGLLRFDGVRFVTFDPDNTPALAHARVEHLFVDTAGTLWANTYDGSLTSVRDGAFRHEWKGTGPVDFEAFLAPARDGSLVFVLDRGAVIRRPAGGAAATWDVRRPPGGALPRFAEDGTGALWIRGGDNRLLRLRGGAFEEVSRRGLAGTEIRSLARDPTGRIWVGTEAEIAVYTGDRFEVMTPLNGEARLDVSAMQFTRDGRLWVIANGRARQANGRTWVWTDDAGRGLTGPSVKLLEDRQGGLWCSHFGKGVLHVRADGRSRWITDADGLPGNRVRDLIEDREGNVWLAIERAGLARLRDAWFEVHPVAGDRDVAISTVAEGRDGALWIGSMGSGLERRKNGVATRFTLPDATAGGFVFSIQPDATGRVWLSADQEDLFYVEADGDRIRRAPVQVHGIKTLLADPDGGLWLGTKTGLSRLERGRLRVFGPDDGFERRDVRALARGPDGAIWIGTGNGTIYRHRAGDARLTRFTPPDGKPVHAVWALHVDADGTLWAGTFRGGLLRLRDGRFDRYTTEHGLPSNIICQVIEDDRQLWLGSANGIVRVAKTAFAGGADAPLPVVRYGRSDGLPTLECSGNYQPAAARTRDGRLWFATPKGLVSVNPQAAAIARTTPLVVLEDVLLDQRPIERARPVAGGAAQELRIPPGQHRLEFRYTGLTFATPDQVRFRYRIDGLEPDWVEAGTQRVAHYGYLPPGRYRFRVAASHGDGQWSPDEAALGFVVLPRFYEVPAVQVAGALAALVVVGLAVRLVSTRRLRRRVERLEMQRAVERDRDRIARDIHDDLGAGLTQITLLSEIARREPPEGVTGHLGQISETARELTRAMDEIVWAINPRHDSLDGLVTYICQFAQEYLTVAGVQCRLDVPSALPARALSADVRHSLFLAVKEVLNNIAKHAHARVVQIRLVEHPGGFRLTIEDDGLGFTEDEAVLVHAHAGRTTPGQGLRNLRERLTAIGGRCVVTSAPGRGTQVSLEVDLP